MPVPSHLTEPAVAGAAPVHDSSDPATPDGLLQIRSNFKWFYVQYALDPGRWMAVAIEEGDDAGVWWLPVLLTLPGKPGLCGHHTKRKGQAESEIWSDAHQRVRKNGGIVLPQRLNYCVSKECVDPRTLKEGFYYMDAWSKPRVKLQGKRQKFSFDRQRYYKWLLHLMREGELEAPQPDVVDASRARLVARVERREAVDFKGDEARKEVFVAVAREWAVTAEEATVPEAYTRGPAVRDATDPDQMTFAELIEAAKALGHKTGGVKTADLRDLVRAGPIEVEA